MFVEKTSVTSGPVSVVETYQFVKRFEDAKVKANNFLRWLELT
jgi:hypothetical protein